MVFLFHQLALRKLLLTDAFSGDCGSLYHRNLVRAQDSFLSQRRCRLLRLLPILWCFSTIAHYLLITCCVWLENELTEAAARHSKRLRFVNHTVARTHRIHLLTVHNTTLWYEGVRGCCHCESTLRFQKPISIVILLSYQITRYLGASLSRGLFLEVQSSHHGYRLLRWGLEVTGFYHSGILRINLRIASLQLFLVRGRFLLCHSIAGCLFSSSGTCRLDLLEIVFSIVGICVVICTLLARWVIGGCDSVLLVFWVAFAARFEHLLVLACGRGDRGLKSRWSESLLMTLLSLQDAFFGRTGYTDGGFEYFLSGCRHGRILSTLHLYGLEVRLGDVLLG